MKMFWIAGITLIAAACNNSKKNETTTNDSMTNMMDTTNRMGNDTTSMNNNMMNNTGDSITAANPADTAFFSEAGAGGMEEVDLGNLASSQSTNSRVQQFGQMMVHDHSQANNELSDLARRMSVTLPAMLPAKMQKDKDELTKKQGKDFDKAYINMMVNDHVKDISLFEKTSKNTKNTTLKAWVDKTLPTLRMHLDSAKAVQKSVK
jgi:putative membrane protein